MSKQSFLKGTVILIVAGLITRIIGFFNRIIMVRLIGEEGIGLYNMAIPTLFLVYTLSQIGLPTAIAKRVAEANVQNNQRQVKNILIVSLLLTGGLSLLFVVLIIVTAPYLAKYLLTDTRTVYPLIAMTPMIPITGLTSVLRGYFQGMQNMKPQSYAQILEQIVRIGTITFFVNLLLPYGIEFAVVGAMLSGIAGELISFLYLLSYFKLRKATNLRSRFLLSIKKAQKTIRSLFSIAIPSTGSRLISSLSNFLEPILVAQSLTFAGFTTAIVTKQYGLLTGYAMPLLFFPTFITHALAIALIPNISEADARNARVTIHYRIDQAIRISFASGAIATVVLFLFADPILELMYNNNQASSLIQFLAPFYLFVYLQFPLNSALQALDHAKVAMWNTLIATIAKYVILVMFTSQARFGIFGTVLALAVTAILTTFLHYGSLKKLISYQFGLTNMIKMICLIGLTYLTGIGLIYWIPSYQTNQASFFLLIAILSTLYLIYVFLLKIISYDELKPLFRKR